MTQNTSPAVMAQRIEPPDALDDFPTQPWGTRALCEHVIDVSSDQAVWEPACNRGYMARPLQEYFGRVYRSDIFGYDDEIDTPDYPGQDRVCDFLFPAQWLEIENKGVDWVITNPPFRLAEEFMTRASAVVRLGYAMLVRTQFLEGVGRYNRLFNVNPPTIIAHFAERLPLVKGRCDPKATTATSYSWLAWIKRQDRKPTMWIPPCRKRLERDGDYPSLRKTGDA